MDNVWFGAEIKNAHLMDTSLLMVLYDVFIIDAILFSSALAMIFANSSKPLHFPPFSEIFD